MCKNVSGCFSFLSTLWILVIFATTLLNFIFSTLNTKTKEAFNKIELINYKEKTYYNFWYEIDFGKDLQAYSDYRASISSKEKCYKGECRLNKKYYFTKNCSDACMNKQNECFYNDQKCDNFSCSYYNFKEPYSVCEYYNRITKWRNTQMLKYHNIYDVIPYSQIKPHNGICPYGYKKCGIINQNKDILCLNEDIFDFKCPINDIIVSQNENPPDGSYKRFPFGDKYIYYTNEKTDNYIITNFYVSFDIDKTKYINVKEIDQDSFSNFSSFNNISFGNQEKGPLTAYLNVIQFFQNYTYQEIMKYQELYDNLYFISTDEKINEMNSEVKKNKDLLSALGIASFSYMGFFLFVICIYGECCKCGDDCSKECDCKCDCCVNLTPIKRVIHFYICVFPCIVLSFMSLIITISKMRKYNKYSSIKYIDECKNGDHFDNSVLYNKIQFICLIINISIIVIYPILVKISFKKRKDDYSLITNIKKNDTPSYPLISKNHLSSNY